MTPPTDLTPRPRPSASDRVAAGVLVLIPVVALLWVPSYTKVTPRLWGFPFFYWYSMLWLFLGTACVVGAYLVLSRAGRTGGDES